MTLLLAGAACSSRERLNPFDPENPDTGGRPAGFHAIAGNALVTLAWNVVVSEGLLGYRLERRLEGDTAWVVIAELLTPATSATTDFGLRNGIDHHYRLQFVFAGGPNGRPVEDVAAPGPQRPWVADLENNLVYRLTPDTRRVRNAVGGFAGPTQLAADPATGAVWVCDFYGNDVVLVPADGALPRSVATVPGPSAVAIDARTGNAWVADPTNDRLIHLSPAGGTPPPVVIPQVLDALAIAVDRRDGSLWVCEGRGGLVRRFTPEGQPMWAAPIVEPWRVALDSLTGAGWVSSFTQRAVYLVAQDGAIVDTVTGLQGPIGVAVDARRGRIWVADARAGAVLALRRDGSVEFRVGDLPEVREIALDPVTGDVWVTVPAEEAVARIASTGSTVRKVFGLGDLAGIALDPGVR